LPAGAAIRKKDREAVKTWIDLSSQEVKTKANLRRGGWRRAATFGEVTPQSAGRSFVEFFRLR